MAERDYGPRVGADPEMFVQNGDGTVVPVCGKIGGTKEQPWIINNLVDAVYGVERIEPRRRGLLIAEREVEAPAPQNRHGDYAVQEDNVMLEFNIPAYTRSDYFTTAIGKAMNVIEANILGPKQLFPKIEVMNVFKAEDIAEFPQALQIGCLPDFNAYGEEGARERQPFSAMHFGNNRFCGGHIHVQYNSKNVPKHIFVQYMDLFVCLPFLKHDRQKLRRQFYGQPGIYREKPYGIEYRTLSNFWLKQAFRDSGNLGMMIENVFYLARYANENPEILSKAYSKIDWGDVQQAIKSENQKLAHEIISFAQENLHLSMHEAFK